MHFVLSGYTVVYCAAAVVSLLAGISAHRRRRWPGGRWLVLSSAACFVWALAVGLDYSSVGMAQHLVWAKVSYLGATPTPVFVLVFALAFAGYDRWTRPKYVAGLLAVPAVVIALAFTNELHHLVWTTITVVPGQPNLAIYGHGPVYWAITVYALVLVLIASTRLLGIALGARSLYRSQGIALAVAVLLPWAALLWYSLESGSVPGFEPSATLVVTNTVLVFTMLRYRLLDALPVPRSVLVEQMPDGVVVLDHEMRVVEVNPAALDLLGVTDHPRKVSYLRDVLAHWPEAAEAMSSLSEGEHAEVLVSADGRCVSLDCLPLAEGRGGLQRSLYTLRDVTAQMQAERALHDAVADLQTRMAEIETLQAELHEQAIRDPLTGLYNRRYLAEALDRELGRATREGYPVSIVMFDVDYFKEINDKFGHAAGDAVLRALGAEVRAHRRAGDIACRYGGDEFLLMLPNTPAEAAARVAVRWSGAWREAIRTAVGSDVRTSLSLGVAAFPTHGLSAADVIAAADSAVYASKSSGRGCVSAAPAPAA